MWQHSFALLLVPLAVLCPRLSVAWLVPCVMWVMPFAAFTPANTIHRTVFLAALLGTVDLRVRAARARRAAERPASPRSWHTARVAMRPTHRVRIEYCVP